MAQINIPTKIIYHSDNLNILRGIDSGTVDLIYLDPPFNKNDTFIGNNKRIQEIKAWYSQLQHKHGMFAVEDFDEIFKDNAQFKDTWNQNDIQKEWYGQIERYNHDLINYFDYIRKSAVSGAFFYLIFMTIRLIELHRILKDTGSIYLHCDATMSHSLKIILDKIFGNKHFTNEIIWRRGHVSKHGSLRAWQANHDTILLYRKHNAVEFNQRDYEYRPYAENTLKQYKYDDNDGRGRYRHQTLRTYGGDTINQMDKQGKIVKDNDGNPIAFKQYLTDKSGVRIDTIWDDIEALEGDRAEKTGYPTQKPLALLERIIRATSHEGDIVLDPFCGCATTCVAAEKLDRKWIGIDWSKLAYFMVFYRLSGSFINNGMRAGLHMLYNKILLETKPPTRSDVDGLIFYQAKTKQELKSYKIPTAATLNIDPQYKQDAVDLLYDEQSGLCNGCNTFLKKIDLTLDHIQPWSQTHNNDIDNLQLLCYRCSNRKRTGTMLELLEKLYKEGVISKELFREQRQKHSSNGALT